MSVPTTAEIAAASLRTLLELRRHALDLELGHRPKIRAVPASHRASASNLLHYLALRQHDIRTLQQQLRLLGVSRLAAAEAHTLASLDAVAGALRALAGLPAEAPGPEAEGAVAIAAGEAVLRARAEELFGPARASHASRIMVTLPSEAASQPKLLHDLLNAGLDIIRINCAHDGPEAWLAMIGNLRAAEQATGRRCKVHADLAGPKLRTGAIAPIGRLVEFKPERDSWGRVTAPARIWLTPRSRTEPASVDVDACLPVDDAVIAAANARDILDVQDSRGSQRHLRIKERFGDSWLALCFQRGYIPDGSPCELYREDKAIVQGTVGPLPEVCLPIQLRIGDKLLVTSETRPGQMARHDEAGRLLRAASIPCTLDAVFPAAEAGQAIWFDDGRLGGRILDNHDGVITVEITHASPQGSKLRAEKGINLPDTDLAIPALTEQDKADLAVLAPHIDMVGLSFVRHPADLADLQQELTRLGAGRVGTVVKIETRQAFEHLPEILLAGLRHPPLGVMVARGDLAVEIGFERLSEVQEEILWLCEAAHVPVVWATQVLETMTKRGIPSRAEVSDAALSARAECVMLNKGPYIVETTAFLSDILTRMEGHRAKRSPTMRRLAVSDLPGEAPAAD
ncbi:pyruvate kinase [Parasulfuritortus cantonensis]|uniref:pyruvate kinase n=1 Tax=Parasulfuritortus cantonensis TaxID=2528202 RepID=A0A4R1BLB2_9PROT|nr:pyruvate kinase [Parasulfuritortus cantonensis]TCJ18210.1 pyruvate kinase [Parasulfuritortus cantonensis]